jgi:hypothetical protein
MLFRLPVAASIADIYSIYKISCWLKPFYGRAQLLANIQEYIDDNDRT